ncbi:MAG: hypothetical protein E7672_08525 [Ruminococcaceae bacterium]|nr:hypothetical protein [Oscillospiraceae bacterium]
MKKELHPDNNSVIDTHTDIQNSFINKIRTEGITVALEYLLPIKNGRESSYPATVRLSWIPDGETSYNFEISENEDFSDAFCAVTAEPSFTLTNLKVGQKYYWRVNCGDAYTFETEDNRFRFIKVEGALNVRDLGGINIKQGLIYRGSEIEGDYQATENGIHTLKNQLRIKTEINLRKESDSSRNTSSIGSDVQYKYLPYRPYCEIFEEEHRVGLVKIMETLSSEENYPVYIHCLGGADRTGMIAIFLRALLGESDEDIFTDYDLTSLSSNAFGLAEGVSDSGFRNHTADYFKNFHNAISAYGGKTLAENIEAFVLECGVNPETIEKIRNILRK